MPGLLPSLMPNTVCMHSHGGLREREQQTSATTETTQQQQEIQTELQQIKIQRSTATTGRKAFARKAK